MTSQQPKIDVHLRADPTCDLSHETRFSLVVLLTLHHEKSITIVKSDHEDPSLVNILVSESIECFDTLSGQKVAVVSTKKAGTSQPKSADAQRLPQLMSLNDNRADYVTFTSAASPREYEYLFETKDLQPNRGYTIRCKPSHLPWWSHTSLEGCVEYLKIHGELPPSETPPLLCEPKMDTISFACRENTPSPPKIDVSLVASTSLSLSSQPPFRFSTRFTSKAVQPITVLAQRQDAMATNSDIEIIDIESHKRVAPDLIDDGNNDGPWRREDFLVLNPGKGYVEERTLRMRDGLENLQLGKEYVLRHVKSRWSWWSFDGVDKAVQLAKDGRLKLLSTTSSIDLECRDECKIQVVE